MNRQLFQIFLLRILFLVVPALVFSSCSHKDQSSATYFANQEFVPDTAAMHALEGIWIDSETESVVVRIQGDTIYYPDTAALNVRFAIFDDTLFVFAADTICYPIIEQKPHLLRYESLSGDIISLHLSENPDDSILFCSTGDYSPILINEEVSRDTVVYSPDGERYHLYVNVNPTRYRVYQTTYNDEGLAADHFYYDNIIHVGVYQGKDCLFSRDFKKTDFLKFIPQQFLDQAILSNMEFGPVDRKGCHFNATLCRPDGASCYIMSLCVNYVGELTLSLLGY